MITGTIPVAATQDNTVTYVAGESITKGNGVYIAPDSKVYKAKADSISTMPCIGIALASGAINASIKVIQTGAALNVTKDEPFIPGNSVFVSPLTAGAFTPDTPETVGEVQQNVGIATNENSINFDQGDYIVIGS